MYDESQPTPSEPNPSPAREGQEKNEGEGSGQNGQDQSQNAGKKDDAQASNARNPPAPAPPAQPAKPAVKRPYVKPRTPEQKALDDAIVAHERTALAIKAAREKLAAAGRAKAIKKGREVVIAGIEQMTKGQLEALVGMLPPGSDAEQKATREYRVALEENAEIARKKLLAEQSK